jgi:hypothetical protein
MSALVLTLPKDHLPSHLRAASETIGNAIAITGDNAFSHLPEALELRGLAIRAGVELAQVTAVGKTQEIRACALAADVGIGLRALIRLAGRVGSIDRQELSPPFSEGELLVTLERARKSIEVSGSAQLSIVYVPREFRAAGVRIYIGPQHQGHTQESDKWCMRIGEFWRPGETETPSILTLLPLFHGGSVVVHCHEDWSEFTTEWSLSPTDPSLPEALEKLEATLRVLSDYHPVLVPSGCPKPHPTPYVVALSAVKQWEAAATETRRRVFLSSAHDG